MDDLNIQAMMTITLIKLDFFDNLTVTEFDHIKPLMDKINKYVQAKLYE